jgi:hypothetical protein
LSAVDKGILIPEKVDGWTIRILEVPRSRESKHLGSIPASLISSKMVGEGLVDPLLRFRA